MKKEKSPLFITSLLQDVDFGSFEGLTIQQLLQKYSDAMNVWQKNPKAFTFPQGESIASARKRALQWLTRVEELPFGPIACVSHHAFLKILLLELLHLPFSFFHKFHLLPATATVVEERGGQFSLRSLNSPPPLIPPSGAPR